MGVLYIVATPIGNPGDITLRAIEVLQSAGAVICEERRTGSTLLKRLGIEGKELILLNEHNEPEQAAEITKRMALGENFALISDAGTPVFADPGHTLIAQAAQLGIEIVPIPGASSLMAALSVLDFQPTQFYFGGFLPRDKEQRARELTRLRALRTTLVLMDTPYRLAALLEEIKKAFGKGQKITLALDITLPKEQIYRGPVAEVAILVGKLKAEFVLIVHGPGG